MGTQGALGDYQFVFFWGGSRLQILALEGLCKIGRQSLENHTILKEHIYLKLRLHWPTKLNSIVVDAEARTGQS